ncbi:uncharacterized protein M421DRAFT_420766 [Didymella exigua CBS 183.55]|uniref:Uncharacterized protein n=1 Tax=Didymella exigua CBS 183.55 TaxID=1150837 RepID=A0A6A5RIP7_9PLEO|nr:uncharacterized protein M421DRAFT_420766 [Didymella exigua CBS 183.55]KAF1928231.1 hypothetical protein M421DRAFT_420766 [Didymella exigua CBS 183.55]
MDSNGTREDRAFHLRLLGPLVAAGMCAWPTLYRCWSADFVGSHHCTPGIVGD